MPEFTAQDVKRLRDATGAGMLDAKKALEEVAGDFGAAKRLLREKGLAKASERAGRENVQGAVALAREGDAIGIVQLKCETDFVAKSDSFINVANDLAATAATEGADAVREHGEALDDLKITLKENIELGEVVRVDVGPGQVADTYVHSQEGRGVNAVAVVLEGGTRELAHDVAVHIAFAKPEYLRRDEVPSAVVEAERATLETQTRNEGKPEQAIPKIVEGKLNGFFKERVLLDQPYAKDDKINIAQLLNGVEVVRYAQVLIGA